MLSADTNIFIHAADPDSPLHSQARDFFQFLDQKNEEFVLCELVLVELYMLLRNPAVFAKPYTASEAAGYCSSLKQPRLEMHRLRPRSLKETLGLRSRD